MISPPAPVEMGVVDVNSPLERPVIELVPETLTKSTSILMLPASPCPRVLAAS
jgi:hypothetical protein